MNSTKIIGVELSGTLIRAGLVEGGIVKRKSSVPTPVDCPQHEIVQTLFQAIDEVFDAGAEGIGMAVPGLYDLENHSLVEVGNLPGWEEIPLHERITDYFNKPLYINSISNAFACGEKFFGKGKNYSAFVAITIGSGFNAGMVINNRLYSGLLCGAGEFGNLFFCEKNLDWTCSGQFFKEKGLNEETVLKRATIGDPVALKLFAEFGTNIGKAISNILFAVAPEAIIIGGPLKGAYRFFSESMFEYLDDFFPVKKMLNHLAIEVSDNPSMDIIGAASLVMNAKSTLS